MRRLLLALARAAVLVAPAAPARADELRVTGARQLTARLWDYAMETPALARPVHTRILLPDGYDTHRHRRYPVLWLLHGGFGSVRDWTESGDAEKLTAGRELIVVMPEDGAGGWYTDWYNNGAGGPPQWETFHMGQLLPWVDATFRTIPDRGHRAIAGLSTGGFGAMHDAARHPDLFSFAASFSGAVDVLRGPLVVGVIGAEAITDGGGFDDVFGNRIFHEIGWRAGNPVDLAGNLRGLNLQLYSGDGTKGPFERWPTFDIVEWSVHDMTDAFARRLTSLGIPYAYDDYGGGTHSWPYWQRDLQRALPAMMATFDDPRPAPSPFTYTSADRRYDVYGFSVRNHRSTLQAFTTLADADRDGFRLDGAHGATVTTPCFYRPRRLEVVWIGGRRTLERADACGALTLDLPDRGGLPVAVRIT